MKKQLNRLTQKITPLHRQLHLQEDGSYEENWTESQSCWAQIKPCGKDTPRFDEGWGAQAPLPSLWQVTLRYKNKKFQRLRWRDRVYTLVSQPIWDDQRTYLTFNMCEVIP